jgi:hypothetical protein
MKKLAVLLAGASLFAPSCVDARPRTTTAPGVSIADVSCTESASTCTLTITKERSKSYSIVTVTTVDGTATAGMDYTAVNQSFTLGGTVTSKTFTVPIVNDSAFEPTEQFTVVLKSARNAAVLRSPATVTITDDDFPVGGGPGSTQPPPTPVPTEPVNVANGTHGENDIADNFTTSTTLTPTIETVPASLDPAGAFRFTCLAGDLKKDDPIVYPGQPGKSHLHQFFGNTLTDANSTYTSLRTTGGSTCTRTTGVSGQRTAYWMPAMLDGAGNAVKADLLLSYYKALPASSPDCGPPDATHIGICIPLPNGIRYVQGYNMGSGVGGPATTDSSAGSDAWRMGYDCVVTDGSGVSYTGTQHTIAAIVATGKCPIGAWLRVFITLPDCWDGVHLDTADHRSHMAVATGAGVNGRRACPADHPYNIPEVAEQAYFRTDANFAAGLWRLSSDEMVPGVAAGTTLHFDYWEAWSPVVKNLWQTGCINGHFSCNVGETGTGQTVVGMSQVGPWPNHVLVPLSSIP